MQYSHRLGQSGTITLIKYTLCYQHDTFKNLGKFSFEHELSFSFLAKIFNKNVAIGKCRMHDRTSIT